MPSTWLEKFFNSLLSNRLIVSTRAEYSLEDVLGDDELLEEFRVEGDVRDLPDAELRVVGRDDVVVTSPGVSLAGSFDRFKGPMSPGLEASLNGFYGEFRDSSGDAVVIVGEELKRFLGDEAVARFPEDDAGYAVDVKVPGEVIDTVDMYDSFYAGDISGDFRKAIEDHRFVVPALYDETGVIPETAIALMNTEGVAVSDRTPEPDDLVGMELEGEYSPDSMDISSVPAPDSGEVKMYVDVLLPPGYDEVRYGTSDGRVFIQAGEVIDSTSIGDLEILDEEEKNGVYTLELG